VVAGQMQLLIFCKLESCISIMLPIYSRKHNEKPNVPLLQQKQANTNQILVFL
jgi:hypothetical protein